MDRRTPPPSETWQGATSAPTRSAAHTRLLAIANSVVASSFAGPPGTNTSPMSAGSSLTAAPVAAPHAPEAEAEIERVTNGLDRQGLRKLCLLYAREVIALQDTMGGSGTGSMNREVQEHVPPRRRGTQVQRPTADENLHSNSTQLDGLAPFASETGPFSPQHPERRDSLNTNSTSGDMVPILAVEQELDQDVEEGDRSRASPQILSLSPGLKPAAPGHEDKFNLSTSALVHHDGTGEVEQVNSLLFFEKLGSGATGSVWHCVDEDCGEERAVKIIPRSKLSVASPTVGEDSAPSLIDEVNFMRGLQHRHIVRLYELIDDADRDEVFIVMDYVKGGSIASLDIKTGACPRLKPSDVAVIAFQIGSALFHCHRLGFTHGDVKPDNVLSDTVLSPILAPVVSTGSTILEESTMSFAESPGSSHGSPSHWDSSMTSIPPKTAPFAVYLADFGVAAAVRGQRQCRRQSVVPGGLLGGLDDPALADSPALPAGGYQAAFQPAPPAVGNPARWTPRHTSVSPTASVSPQRAQSAFLTNPEPPSGRPGGVVVRASQYIGGGRSPDAAMPTDAFANVPMGMRRGSQSLGGSLGANTPVGVTFDEGSPHVVTAEHIELQMDEADLEEELRRRSTVGSKAAAVQGTTPILEAPERMEGGERTPATDMWALGVTIYALLFGRVPFFADTYAELRRKVLTEEPSWPPETTSGVYSRWRRVLSDMLKKDPRTRLTAPELRRRRVARPQ